METTLNIHIDVLAKITLASQEYGIPRSDVIILLIKKVMDKMENGTFVGKLVQYQERDHIKKWHTFHIQLRPDDYEYMLDLRKLLKKSVSCIVAYAVQKYLTPKVKLKITDKNLYKNYIIMNRVIDNIICWKLFWGYPQGINRHLKT